ncbi:sugar phosphate nucleotidyltransferase [Gottfriedia solisilvae]|uniref:nucleotidyltransferase family protein n=1 Tax=Gottfriedia solisilvae TaxID=1516104 RepID=UPI003D2EE0AC
MKVVILAGGFGQRLLPITNNIPKPLLPIANRAAIEHLLLHLISMGFNEFIIQLHYMSQAIMKTIDEMNLMNISIEYIIEEESLGSAGCLRLSKPYLNDTFLLVNGDILFDGDIREAIYQHLEYNQQFSMLVKHVDKCESYGNVKVKNGQIMEFIEKPQIGKEISNLVNTGIYILNAELLKYIPDYCYFDISTDLIPLLLRENIILNASELKGYWIDYGTPRRFAKLNVDWIEEKLNLPIPAVQILPRIFLGEHVKIENNVKIVSPVIIGNDVTIEENCIIGPYVSISSNIVIDKGSILHHQAVFQKYTLNHENKFTKNTIKKLSKEMQ